MVAILAAVGWVAGIAVFTSVIRWVMLFFYAREQVTAAAGRPDAFRATSLALCESLFHSGPYTVAAVAFVACFTYREDWAPWFFGGFAFGFGFMAFSSVQIALAIRRRKAQRQ